MLAIDHRTLKAQGVERAPTFHIGKDAWHQEKRTGIATTIGDKLRQIVTHNNAVQWVKQWTNQLQQTNPHHSLRQQLQRAKEAMQQWALPLPALAVERGALKPVHMVQVPPRSHDILNPSQEKER